VFTTEKETKVKAPETYPAFLGDPRRRSILDTLNHPEVQWADAKTRGRVERGTVHQLASDDVRLLPRVMALKQWYATRVHEHLAADWSLPAPGDLDVQVFPVHMAAGDGTRLLPHVDSTGGATPLVTTIYYVNLDDVEGGELIAQPGPDGEVLDESRIVSPQEDLLVAMDGQTLHAVAPLQSGSRISLVCNFYG
jgi:hypothetical protein